MVVTKKIMELLKTEKLTAKQIAEKTETKEASVKTTIYNLFKRNRVLREKMIVEKAVKTGPKYVYIYSLPHAD